MGCFLANGRDSRRWREKASRRIAGRIANQDRALGAIEKEDRKASSNKGGDLCLFPVSSHRLDTARWGGNARLEHSQLAIPPSGKDNQHQGHNGCSGNSARCSSNMFPCNAVSVARCRC